MSLLRAEVERQLLADLAHYGIRDDLRIDWSDSCGEGHCTRFLNGQLESQSGIKILDGDGEVVAEGWSDFVHGGDGLPLFVFWLFLSLRRGDGWQQIKDRPILPAHIWDRLPDASRTACCRERSYDASWSKDPKVLAWKRDRDGAVD